MKHLLFLLFSIATFGQVSTGNETPFDYGIQNTAAQLVGNSDYVVTQGNDGTYGKYLFNLNQIEKKQYLSTGLIKNGLLTANADPTKYNITAGVGIISNFDNPDVPTSTLINFGAIIGHTPAYLNTSNITYMAINGSGALVEQASPFTAIQRRSLILIGAVVHSNLTTINSINNISAPTNADTNQLHDFMEAVGALNISGNKFEANGANLQLNKTAGKIFKLGINFANDWKDPHSLSQIATTALTFRYRTQNGTEGSDVTSINPAVYDLANVLTAVPSNKFSIQTVTIFQTGIVRIQYGQNVYNTLSEAEAAIFTRNYNVEPNIAANGITRAYIIVKNTTTSLQNISDAKIVEAGKFGSVGGGGGAITLDAIVAALGYTPENVANKSDSYTVSSSTTYASTKAVVDGLAVKNWIKSNESLSLAQRKDDVLHGILDQYTGEEMTLSKVTGTPTVDGVIYFQLGSEYFKRDNLEKLNVNNFGAKGDDIQDDTAAIQLMINKIGYFKLLTGTYKITSSLLVRNITFYDTNFRGIDFERSIINCVGMSLVSAIKEESNTNAIRANFYDFKIIGDALNAINLSTTSNIYLSRFENLSLSSTGDCFSLKNDFDCVLNNIKASSVNGNSFTLYGLNTVTLQNCYAAVCGSLKSGFRIYNFATLTSCNGVNSGGTWGTFGANIADDGFDATANINFIGCNFEDYEVRALRFSYVSKVNLIGCSFYPKATGTYPEDIKFENIDNNINISGVIYSSKGSTITSASKIVSISDIGFIQSNSIVFQDFSRPVFGLVYKIPFYSLVDSEYGVKSLNIPYFNCDRNYGFNLQVPKTWTANSSTFSVIGQSKIKTANSIITSFDSATGGIEGQELYILIKDNFSTLAHMNAGAGRFKMISGANVVCVDGQIYHFIYDGLQWVQQDSNDLLLKSNIASPTFTGTPTAPTATSGTNTTQIATTAFVQGIKPYKVYTALLTQTGTSNPTVKVLENNIGAIVWTRTGIGTYSGTLTGAFTVDKSPVFLTSNNASTLLSGGASGSTNFVGISTQAAVTGILTDALMTDSLIEIRVYL